MSAPSYWTAAAVAGIADQTGAALPRIEPASLATVTPGHDLWDMWPIAHADGATAMLGERAWWFFLETPRLPDPEDRHDAARIRLTSLGPDGWRDHGRVFPDGFTPGSREWSGSAVLEGDRLTLYFTAAGRRGLPRTFEQRLFAAHAGFAVDDGEPRFGAWSIPEEIVRTDPRWYASADEVEAPPHGIRGCRDPGFFHDPATGDDYLLFTANAVDGGTTVDGVVGVAVGAGGGWRTLPPIVSAVGVNSELERAHVVVRDGRYYLFWSTQARRFAPGIVAPTGLYGMVADSFAGPWRPINGTGLVAANPAGAPMQAYCWWVTGEFEVLSFVDYGLMPVATLPASVAERRATFGGTVAPIFRLDVDGDRVVPIG